MFVNMLQILNLMPSKHFWIIKYIILQPIRFAINLNAASSSKVFTTFDYMFPSIVLLFESIKLSIFLKKIKYRCVLN